ncbi:thymidylate synthase [Streptomyces catenulae]|uniref:Thymidylate synthase n=1 Tax=Streptomyces catenulae TaxID=66875 RepID=A0ABV2Z0F1_9ACTN|nr:thymidylate synthase [Streptomyces catenulae]
MHTHLSYPTFEAAYLENLLAARDAPEFVNAPRGFHSREILGVSYRIANPRERIVRIPERKLNLVFNFAESLWYLSGSNALDFIAFYAPSMKKYSADGQRLAGTAYGPRLFGFGGAGINQWDSVARTLRQDADSKRAVMQIFAPEELLVPGNIDVACTLGLQYMIREGALHAVSFMRANDAYRGTVSDVFSFTFLQEVLATQLGLDLGSYTHTVGSYHLYRHDDTVADKVLAARTEQVSAEPFPAMPAQDNWPAIREVLALEEALRKRRLTLDATAADGLGLGRYWTDVVILFALHARWRHEGTVDRDLLDVLHPLFARLVENRWGIHRSLTSPAR